MAELGRTSGHSNIAGQAGGIVEMAREYRKNFELLAQDWIIKGLDYKSGLQGEFRQAAHALADAMPQFAVDDLYIGLLQIRRQENDFQRTGTEADKNRLLENLADFRRNLEKSKCEPAAKIALEKELSLYAKALDSFISTAELSLERNKCQEEMRTAALNMEKTLLEIYVPRAESILLEIRRNEKDHLLRNDRKYIEELHASVARLYNAFKNSGVLPKHVEVLETNLSAYQKAFDALTAKDLEIESLEAE